MTKHTFIYTFALAVLLVAGLAVTTVQADATSTATTTATSTATTTATTTVATPSFTITTQASPKVWAKATRHLLGWNYANVDGKVRAYLVPVAQDAMTSTGILIMKPTLVSAKAGASMLKPVQDADLGYYHVKLVLTTTSGTNYTAISSSTVQITPHGPPVITVTSPKGDIQWRSGTSQRMTWTANFVKGKTKDDTRYPDIRVVPTYGIDPSQKNLDANKFSKADKTILGQLSAQDTFALSQLGPDQLAFLDPANVQNIAGLSATGKKALEGLSPPGFDKLQEIDPLGITNIVAGIAFKPLEILDSVDPVTHALFGGLFSDDKPNAVKATIYITPVSGGTAKKLKTTYVEKSKTTFTLKGVQPGTYRLSIVAKLKNADISATSSPITVIAK